MNTKSTSRVYFRWELPFFGSFHLLFPLSSILRALLYLCLGHSISFFLFGQHWKHYQMNIDDSTWVIPFISSPLVNTESTDEYQLLYLVIPFTCSPLVNNESTTRWISTTLPGSFHLLLPLWSTLRALSDESQWISKFSFAYTFAENSSRISSNFSFFSNFIKLQFLRFSRTFESPISRLRILSLRTISRVSSSNFSFSDSRELLIVATTVQFLAENYKLQFLISSGTGNNSIPRLGERWHQNQSFNFIFEITELSWLI